MNLYQNIFNLLLSEQLHKLGTYYDDPRLKPKGPVKPRPPTEEEIIKAREKRRLPKRVRPKSV